MSSYEHRTSRHPPSATTASDIRAVTAGQRMMWLMNHYQGAHGALNCPVILALHGALDIARLQRAWETVFRRHEALRTVFVGQGQRLGSRVGASSPSPWKIEELAGTEPATDVQDSRLQKALREELRRPFDVTGLCLRIRLWRLHSALHVLCVNQHHLITDAVSCGLITRELGQAYDGLPLSPVVWQFDDHVQHEARWLASAEGERSNRYWQERLAGAGLVSLPRRPVSPPARDGDEGDTVSFHRARLAPAVAIAIEKQARAAHASVFVWLLAVFKLHLHRITGSLDIPIGTLLANRNHPEGQGTVGFLANMIVLRTPIGSKPSLRVLTDRLRESNAGAAAHQRWPYQLLPAGVVPTEAARGMVFQLFAQPTHVTRIADLDVHAVDPPDGLARRFDLDLVLMPEGGTYRVVLAASDRRFSRRWADSLLRGYAALVEEQATRAPASSTGVLAP